MTGFLPRRITDYNISAASPTEDLLTLGRLFSEAGGYAATLPDGVHRRVARMCDSRFRKTVGELIRRGAVSSVDELYELPADESKPASLESLTIAGLERLYRLCSGRRGARLAEGREHFTCYYERRIVDELGRRKAADLSEQLKIDYCTIVYRNELRNMSVVFTKPVGSLPDGEPAWDSTRSYTPSELGAWIALYRGCRDIAERESLIECLDYVIDLLAHAERRQPLAGLAAEVLELDRTGVARCPAWVGEFLADTVARWVRQPEVPETEMVMPLLTLAMAQDDWTWQRKAQRIVNRCYRACVEGMHETDRTADDIYIAAVCRTYVTRFSRRKMAACWNRFCETVVASGSVLTSTRLGRLLEAADELEGYAPLSGGLKAALADRMEELAGHGDLEALIHRRRMASGHK